MGDRVELIGVGDPSDPEGDGADLASRDSWDGVGSHGEGGVFEGGVFEGRVGEHSVGQRTTHLVARRNGLGLGRVLVVAALITLGFVILRSPTVEPDPDAASPAPAEQTQRAQPPRADAPSSPSAPPTTRWSASAVVPVAPAAEGVTLIVGRGVEKTFISLGQGTKTVVDVEGVPVAGAPGFVALSVGNDSDLAAGAAPDCWFSIADRACRLLPTSIDPVADVDVFDQAAVRSLTAVTADGRWEAGWRAGQLFVTDRQTGEDSVVPDIRRSYFDDALVLVG